LIVPIDCYIPFGFHYWTTHNILIVPLHPIAVIIMAPVEALPDFVIYTLLIAVSIMLSLIVVFGGYHICCLRHNILTDDFDQHLMPCDSMLPSHRRENQPVMSVFEQDGLDSRYFGPPNPTPPPPPPLSLDPNQTQEEQRATTTTTLQVNNGHEEETIPVSDSRYFPPQLT
jgi:hypothetical protein